MNFVLFHLLSELLMSVSLLGIPDDPRVPPMLLGTLCSWGCSLTGWLQAGARLSPAARVLAGFCKLHCIARQGVLALLRPFWVSYANLIIGISLWLVLLQE